MNAPVKETEVAVRRVRDPRLDFFRGLGMIIILIAHIPKDPWVNWIPARFGFSDAADMFVFCSGMASALAFGSVFADRGWLMGTARILHRMWQVYWAHIGSCLVFTGVVIALDRWLGTEYFTQFTLEKIFSAGPDRLLQLLTLRYIPEVYFDILPMYLVLLGMIPIVMALARMHTALVFVFMAGLWLCANVFGLNWQAQPEGGRVWYFNPFAWQIVFFSGFALMRGWWPAPPRDWRLLAICVTYVLLASPVSCQASYACHAGFGHVPMFGTVHDALAFWIDKTDQGLLRYAHFMATVYIAWYLAGEFGRNLKGPVVETVRRMGTQTLAVFLTSLVIAPALGALFDLWGTGFFVALFINILGIALLIAGGRITGWFKSSPWRTRHPKGSSTAE
jgi:hypothetical protein